MPNNPRAQNPFPGPATKTGYQTIARTCSEREMIRLATGNLQITECCRSGSWVGPDSRILDPNR